jgi:hypothetical protein
VQSRHRLYRNPIAMPTLEYMAIGKPKIMGNIGDAREQVHDGESDLLFPAAPWQPSRIALTSARRGQNGRTRRMGVAARRRSEVNFSSEYDDRPLRRTR